MNLNGKHYVIILAALATAFLHITLWPDIMFTLNGLGYLALLAAYFLPIPFFQERRKLVWWALAGYTLLTIILCHYGDLADHHGDYGRQELRSGNQQRCRLLCQGGRISPAGLPVARPAGGEQGTFRI
jgi:hypothetical protein